VELVGCAALHEPFPHRVAPKQPRDVAQNFDVLARRRLRAHDQPRDKYLGQLRDGGGFVACHHRYDDTVGGEQVAQQHGPAASAMCPNVTHRPECDKPFTPLSLGSSAYSRYLSRHGPI
jgi:hypothetical protein